METLIALAAEGAVAIEETGGIGAIGINASALVFQVVNFALLLWLLKKFAYRPILKVLEKRRAVIEESLRSAQEIKVAEAALEKERERILDQARRQAHEVLAKSRQQASEVLRQAEVKSQQQSEQIKRQATSQIEQERIAVWQGLKREALSLVAHATEQVIGEKLDEKRDAALLEKALTEAEGQKL